MTPDSHDRNVEQSCLDVLELQSLAIERSVHDIRTLLVAGGYARLLLHGHGGPLTELQRACLGKIVDSTRKIKDVLTTLERLADPQELRVSRFTLKELLEGVLPARVHWRRNAACNICITGDRKNLREAIAQFFSEEFWPGDVSLGMHEEERSVTLVLRGESAPAQDALAGQVHPRAGVSNADEVEVPMERFGGSRDILRLHGGSVSVRRMATGQCEVLLKLPRAGERRGVA